MNYFEMYEVYKKTGLYNFLFECLASTDKKIVELAQNEIAKKGFQNADDVRMFIALSI